MADIAWSASGAAPVIKAPEPEGETSAEPSPPVEDSIATPQDAATPSAESAAAIADVAASEEAFVAEIPAPTVDAPVRVGNVPPDIPATIDLPFPKPPAKPAAKAPLAWGAKVSPEFRDDVRAMCVRLGCEPDHMMAAIAFESVETFSPAVKNPLSGATGLIQFMGDTAEQLGTSIADLSAMTPEEQLVYVEKYFQPFRGKLSTLEDVYMAILWPRAVGQPNDIVLFTEGSVQYAQNSGLDVDGDGNITKQETAALVMAALHKGLRQQNAG